VSRLVRALRLWALFTAALLLAFAAAPPGRALADDETDVTAPVDAPLVGDVHVDALPPLPAGYEVQTLGWWSIAYPEAARSRLQPIIDEADGWKAQLAADFGQDVLSRPIEVRVGRTWNDMAALAPREIGVPPYASGVTYAPLRLVLLTLTEPHGGGDVTDLDTVFHHELSHMALFDAALGHEVPRWFNEGVAVYESGEHPVVRMRTLFDAALFHQLAPVSELDRMFGRSSAEVDLAYAESADVVRFLLRGKDRLRFFGLVGRVRSGSPFDRALGDAYGTDLHRLEYQWREDTSKRNTFAPMLASGGFVWGLALVALVLAYRRRRKHRAETLARWEREEAQERAVAVRPAEDETPFTDPARALAGLPKVEHDGGWHTLH
jgi:Peptidase MA superfamily